MPSPLVHVDGIENAIDQFSRLETLLLGDQLLGVFQIAGDAVADRARELVRIRTGETQGAIFVKVYRHDTVPYCLVGVETHEPSFGHEIVSYAGYLEAGTKKMEAHPYIGAAAAEMEGSLLSLVGGAVGQLIDNL